MKPVKNMRAIRGRLSNSSIGVVVSMLEHRPNIWDSARDSYNKIDSATQNDQRHFLYFRGYNDGYRYAIERLKKQIK